MSNNTTTGSSGSSANNSQPTRRNTRSSPNRQHGARDFIDLIVDYLHPETPHDPPASPASPASSASSASETDLPAALLCAICSRRENKVLFTVCGHRACISCTKRLWNSTRNINPRHMSQYNPRPISFPCPFCRLGVVWVMDDLRADPELGGVPTPAGEGERGARIVEWMLKVSRAARERLEMDKKNATQAGPGGTGGAGGSGAGGSGAGGSGAGRSFWQVFTNIGRI